MKHFYLYILLSIIYQFSFSQIVPTIRIKKAQTPINLDGTIDEPDWLRAETASSFCQVFPFDTSEAYSCTEVKLTYDNEFLYVAAICYDSSNSEYVIQSLKRDFSYPASDAFAVYFDPLNDKTNGFCFGVNPLGVQREGLISNGGGFGVTTIWDNKWYSKTKIYADKWVVEMAIPFKTLRYKAGETLWHINFSRNNLKINENSSWSAVPRNFNVASLAFTGELYWDEPPKKAGANISLIPYITGNTYKDYTNNKKQTYGYNGGLDAKIAVTSSLNLDITINPDFSQVEVDRQVTNLSRFSIFFPERRNFFIENSDLFERFGFRQIRPFFSRNIGLYNGQIVPILGGFRLSGNINRNWRIGIMNMQTEHKRELGLESQNYTVAAISRRVFERSNISAIFVNKQEITTKGINPSSFNRIAGIDFNLQSKNNRWIGKAFYHQAFMPNQLKEASANATFLNYNSPKYYFEWNHEYVGKNYLAEVGFVPRIYYFNPVTGETKRESYFRFEDKVQYRIYPNSKLINNHNIEAYVNHYTDSSLQKTEYNYHLMYTINFQNNSIFNLKGKTNFTKIRFPVDVTFTGSNPIPAGDYYYSDIFVSYTSSPIKKLNAIISFDYGEYFNGNKISYAAEINYRKQPWGILGLTYNRDEIYLPKPYKTAFIDLIGPKIEISFTKSLFFTTFVQYNTQINNVNINSRLQWRFKPMSDLYIVYTDNYQSYNFAQKNRALVFKLIYWLNV